MDAVTFEASADLFDLPAGAASLAWGAEYREESYGSRTIEFTSALAPTLRQPPDESRNVLAYFAEARVPVIAPEQDIFGFYRLDLSLAARHEDTSNGGADTTPKIGLTWSPFEGLTFRSALGRVIQIAVAHGNSGRVSLPSSSRLRTRCLAPEQRRRSYFKARTLIFCQNGPKLDGGLHATATEQ